MFQLQNSTTIDNYLSTSKHRNPMHHTRRFANFDILTTQSVTDEKLSISQNVAKQCSPVSDDESAFRADHVASSVILDERCIGMGIAHHPIRLSSKTTNESRFHIQQQVGITQMEKYFAVMPNVHSIPTKTYVLSIALTLFA